MTKAERAGYVALTDVGLPAPINGFCLCSWCKYAEWYGSVCSEDSYAECKHPLGETIDPESEVQYGNGADCWGFRPHKTIEQATDAVGSWLRRKATP